jgi:deoxyribodipyrimidine photolyase
MFLIRRSIVVFPQVFTPIRLARSGASYPQRIVDHAAARKRALAAFQDLRR